MERDELLAWLSVRSELQMTVFFSAYSQDRTLLYKQFTPPHILTRRRSESAYVRQVNFFTAFIEGWEGDGAPLKPRLNLEPFLICLLYTSDAADE